ncbi:MAG: type II toxin-antitoxin system prevent-host-death family antitoxin [Rhizobiales bacterium]|nr:type II toxin-antitoxin system prevent-host-death family antitoxin [Hyphomicrobiales bacterium]
MKHVGIFEAKTHLSSLVDEVEKGQEIVITRHGKPVARLVRAEVTHSPEQIERRRQAIARLNEIANKLKINPTLEEIKSWINEGRH